MTCEAVMVVLLVVPRTRTGSPVAMALADVGLVPFWYVVEDVSLTVTFTPADVDSVKPAVDRLLTVPVDPPAAGPDRALDPPLPNPDRPQHPCRRRPALLLPRRTWLLPRGTWRSRRKVRLLHTLVRQPRSIH
jgi:hypothetical protein